MDLRPHRRLGIGQFLAGPDDFCLGEAGNEARDITLLDTVLDAELAQGVEEVIAVFEGHAKGPADRQLAALHRIAPCLTLGLTPLARRVLAHPRRRTDRVRPPPHRRW